jgi:hypothetical protein
MCRLPEQRRLIPASRGDERTAVSWFCRRREPPLRGHEVGVLFGTIGEKGVPVVVTKTGLKRGPR